MLTHAGLIRAVMVLSLLCAGGVSRGQEEGGTKDDALDRLLEKLDTSTPAQETGAKAGDTDRAAGRTAPEPRKEARGEVAPTDKDLDGLLEKLGETTETPAPDDRPKGPGPGKDQQGQPGPAKPSGPPDNPMNKPEQDLDRHLEELTGRKTKKSKGDGEGGGPLGDVIKQMRDVEERLGQSKPDTGEDTRKKQTEIVKKLDTLIEQMRSAGQSQSKTRSMAMKPGKPGSPQSDTPGSQAGGAPRTLPKKPNNPKSLANGKDEWGHLPPELRQELENVFKEEELPSKTDLTRRYFLSLDKKYVTRGD